MSLVMFLLCLWQYLKYLHICNTFGECLMGFVHIWLFQNSFCLFDKSWPDKVDIWSDMRPAAQCMWEGQEKDKRRRITSVCEIRTSKNPNADLFLLSKDALYDVCRPLSINRLDLLRDMGQGWIGQLFFLQVGVGQTNLNLHGRAGAKIWSVGQNNCASLTSSQKMTQFF